VNCNQQTKGRLGETWRSGGMLLVSGIVCLIVGFILGYGVRASISRHRRRAARRRYDLSGSYRYIDPLADHQHSGSAIKHTILREKIPPNASNAPTIGRHEVAHIAAAAASNVRRDVLLKLHKVLTAASESGQGGSPHAPRINVETLPPNESKPADPRKTSEQLAERLRARIGLRAV
jgi:hypothetical protein